MLALCVLPLGLAGCDGPDVPARLPTPPPEVPDPRPIDAAWIGAADTGAPLVVLLHGYGAPGDDLVPLGRELRARLDRPVRVALPVAPLALGPDARAWWQIELGARPADRGEESPEGLRAARRDLSAWLEAQREAGRLDPERTVLAGFSQGAMLAAEISLRGSLRPRAFAMLSGGPLDEAAWLRAARSHPPEAVFMSHGRRDPLLSFAASRRLADGLRRAGVPVTFEAFDGPHAIPPPVREAFVGWLAGRL